MAEATRTARGAGARRRASAAAPAPVGADVTAPATGDGVTPWQLLDADGRLHGDLPAGLDEDRLQGMMRLMLLGRRLDQKAIALQRRGKLGTYAPLSGQEAASVGSSFAMDRDVDRLVPQYREQLAMIHWGLPLGTYLLQRYGHPKGARLPEHGRLYPQQVALAAHAPHAVGLAWGLRLRGERAAVICHFGDGASSEGDAHEAMNLAGVTDAPVIFVIQNNGWAISVPIHRQTRGIIARRAEGVGIAGVRVDGNDVLAMYEATRQARERAVSGGGATLIEAVTYRLGAHTTADDPTKYVDPAELEAARTRDPLLRFRSWLTAEGMWDEAREEAAIAWIDERIEEAVVEFDAAGPADPAAMFDEVFAEEPPRLTRQRAEYEAEMEAAR
jgi:pyruvate dehydrogenase E1 component alpha subunit